MPTTNERFAAFLRIRDWDRCFETHESRKVKRLGWVSLPNDLIDINYRTLVDHPEGCSHFAAWVALVEIGSTCKVRGTLIESGVMLTPRHFALKSGIPESVFEAAIPRLVSIGWLEELSAPEVSAVIPGDSPGTAGGCGRKSVLHNRDITLQNNTQTHGGISESEKQRLLQAYADDTLTQEEERTLYATFTNEELADSLGGVDFDASERIEGLGERLASEIIRRRALGENIDAEAAIRNLGITV
jgi:hypothetical protein